MDNFMEKNLQKRCEHSEVKLIRIIYHTPFYGQAMCLNKECGAKIIIDPSEYKLVDGLLYQKIESKTT
jgi:hypothetical protein